MKALLLLSLFLAQSVMAQKTDAKLDCQHTGKDFIYDCVIRLTPALGGVQVTVSADMPSMPMAHNIKPVRAQPMKTPGEYRARLDLEMSGEWAVKLRLAGAVRDQLIVHYNFTESGKPPRR